MVRHASADPQLITKSEDLAEFCGALAHAPFITIDTEFLREKTYWPILCLVQIAGPEPDQVAAIDTMAPGLDLAPLAALLKNTKIDEGLPCGAAGCGNLLPHDRRHSQADRRHPGAGDGVRVRRRRQLRDAGRQARQCAAGQAGALHRLGAPAAVGAAARLCAVGRHPSARHLSEAARQGRESRTPRLDRRRDGAADRSRHLRVQSGECLEAAEDALGEAALPRRVERGRGLARARGAEPRRAAQPRAERREHRRDRGARAGDCGSAGAMPRPDPRICRQPQRRGDPGGGAARARRSRQRSAEAAAAARHSLRASGR